ncbi:hypothetical protein [Haloferax sp. DFSO52]|uniref:hypothetical protein n=1 Tax=Haloferax sp. DFSO52 TaxID=3388505 RepID=UPI003A85363F
MPGGLAIDASGLQFDPSETRFAPGTTNDWTFRIVRTDGTTVTEFEEAHGERSHLIVIRRDLTHFQHRHPTLEPDGTWRVEQFTLPEPGAYRVFVDVVVDGHPETLGFDVFAPGTWEVQARPGSTRTAITGAYEVTLSPDEIPVRQRSRLTFEVKRDGAPVSTLGEYLGARGHLVALREGDLAYLHVHPEATAPDSGRVEFSAQFPTAGRYRLFFQAKPEQTLITTSFDLTIDG